MNKSEMATIVALFLSTGGLKVLIDYVNQRRQDRTKAPIEARDATVDAAEHILLVSRQTIDRLQERIESMEKREEQNRREFDELRERIAMVVMPYVEQLRKYIMDGGQPPPPDYPEGWWGFHRSSNKEDK